MLPIRRVLVLVVDGVQSLDVMGPIEVFGDANDQVPGTYRIDVVGPASDGQITMSNGLKLGAELLPEPLPRRYARGGRWRGCSAGDDPAIVEWVARALRGARRTTSICTGSWPAGGGRSAERAPRDYPLELLRGPGSALPRGGPRLRPRVRPRRATSDLGRCDRGDRPRAGPGRRGSRRGRCRRSRACWSCSSSVPRPIAVQRRPVGPAGVAAGALRDLQAWIAGHLDQDLSVAAPADRAAQRAPVRARLPPRSARRRRLRRSACVERARALLEDGAQSPEAVARAAGFSPGVALRFHRRVGVSPAAYRERFRLAARRLVSSSAPAGAARKEPQVAIRN